MSPERLTRREFTSSVAASAAGARLIAPAVHGQTHTRTLLAGAAETVVTPTAEGTMLIGSLQASTGVHDELYARVLVMSDGSKQVALVTMDYLGFDFEYNDRLVRAISAATGIGAAQIMINASHNHNAPMTAPWGDWEKAKDKPWHRTLPEQLAELTQRAIDRLQLAKLRYRREPCRIAYNRRLLRDGRIVMQPNSEGADLPWTDVLSVVGAGGARMATLFCYAAHPIIVHRSSTLITADFPGFAVQALRDQVGEGLYLFGQGCSGNINGHPPKSGLEAAGKAGGRLAGAVARALAAEGGEIVPADIRDVSSEISLPLQQPPSAEECRSLVQQESDPQKRVRFEELLAIAENGEPQSMRFRMRAFALGDELCVLGLSHELFAEYHHAIVQISPFRHNIVLAYTNGCECYVGLKKDYEMGENGGYETAPLRAALLFHRRLPLHPDAETRIKQEVRRLFEIIA